MTEIADDRSWWADVEHLRPGGEGPRPAAPSPPARPVAVADRPVADRHLAPATETAATEFPTPRRLRITGGTEGDADTTPARPRRPDVAAFADALDLDGAFGAPVPSRRSREIILTGAPSTRASDDRRSDVVTLDDNDVQQVDDDASASASAADGGRRTVRIRGTAGVHAEVAERRALREVGEHRPRGAVGPRTGRPDRIAMYVVLLGVFLAFLAVAGQSAGS